MPQYLINLVGKVLKKIATQFLQIYIVKPQEVMEGLNTSSQNRINLTTVKCNTSFKKVNIFYSFNLTTLYIGHLSSLAG